MSASSTTANTERRREQLPVLLFGIAIAAMVLYIVTYAIDVHHENDFYREAIPPYHLLDHGHVVAFLRAGPAYIGSLVLRAPLALLAGLFSAGHRATYVICALPCLIAPGLLAAWLRTNPETSGRRAQPQVKPSRLRPLDLCMLTPCGIVALTGGHPEDLLTAVACIASTLLAQRGSARAAGFWLGVALINKSWAVVAVPLIVALMPADRRLVGFTMMILTAGVILVPVTIIRATEPGGGVGTSLGSESVGIFLVPQLLWWFGRHSCIAREAHVLLVVVCWLVTAVWWWLQRNRPDSDRRRALMMLALMFFLRASLDPWDNLYYYVPFLFSVMASEDPPGFPKLSWIYTILLVIIVPAEGLLRKLGSDGHAGVFAAFALATIAWFGWQGFSRNDSAPSGAYAATAESGLPV